MNIAIRKDTRADFYGLWSRWTRRIVRLPGEWAVQERRIAAGQSPLTPAGEDISYLHEVMPHALEPMDAADDPAVNIIVLWWGRRMAKTEGVCGNIFGRTVTDDPGNILDVWPVEDSADRFSRDVIEPMIEATPSLRRLFVESKSRDAGRTISYKRFAGGSLYIINAGSRSKTRGMAARVVCLHEVDAYPVSAQGEGDPIAKAFGRADGFSAIKIIESTGTIAAEMGPDGQKIYHSNIELWYDRSDQQKWFCPCRKCGHLQWLKWEQIRVMAPKSGEMWFYLCEACDVDHNEKQWRRLVSAGTWKPTAPFVNGIRGYWINGFNSLLPKGKGFKTKLHQFCIEGQRAMTGTPEEKRVWINEVKTELVAAAEVQPSPPWKPIFDRREDYGLIVPAAGLFLTAFTDVQKNRLEVGWRAWGREEESWGMDHVILDGYVGHPEVWRALVRELGRKWKHESGAEMRLGFGLIDGGAYAEEVYRFFQQLARDRPEGVYGKVNASKGLGKFGHPIISRGDMATVAKNLKGRHIGTWQAKDRIYDRLGMSTPATGETREGFMHYNLRFGEEYFIGLTRETATRKIEGGNVFNTYKDEVSGNEPLDIEVGNFAALRLRTQNFDALEAALIESAEAVKNPHPKTQEQDAADSSWVTCGRQW